MKTGILLTKPDTDFDWYSFEDPDTLICGSVSIEAEDEVGPCLAVHLRDIRPDSLINMVLGWDKDVVEAFLYEIAEKNLARDD